MKLLGYVVLLPLLLAGNATAPSPRASASDERAAAFAWFDSLGFGDRLAKPCLRVDWSYRGGKEGTWVEGDMQFLLAETPKGYTLLGANLHQGNVERDDKSGIQWRYVPVDFGSQVLRELDKRSKPTTGGPNFWPYGPVELFVYSRVAAARGLDDLSKHLFDLSKEARQNQKGSYLEDLQASIADGQIEWISLDMGDLRVPREELLERLSEFVRLFPDYKEVPLARSWMASLSSILEADKTRAPQPAKAWQSMSDSEKIDELVYELQDQNGHTVMNPGSCDVFQDVRRDKSPAGRLVQMSYAAVPRLIDALDDERVSRSVDTSDYTHVGHACSPDRVLCVGEVAYQVIERIRHRQSTGTLAHSSALWAQQRPVVEQSIRSWWAQFKERGEQAILAEDVRKGGWDASQEVDILAEKYPAAAPAPIDEGLKQTHDAMLRALFVAALGKCKTPEATALARRLMTEAPELPVRVSAASVVAGTDLAVAAAAMEREWAILRPNHDQEPTNVLVRFLVSSGRPEAVELVRKRIAKLDVRERFDLIELLDGSGIPMEWRGLYRMSPLPKANLTGAYGAAIEHLLATELSDTERRFHAAINGPGVALKDPRICDVAVYDLSKLWPGRYRYRKATSQSEMDAQRLTALNAWRRAHGLSPVSLSSMPAAPAAQGE